MLPNASEDHDPLVASQVDILHTPSEDHDLQYYIIK